MRFIIRDDDLNFFSTPADIERWYADIFAEQIPVGFSTIPFVTGESDTYTNNAPKDATEYPISCNAALVSYVRSQPLIEILQHGTTHVTKSGVFEYQQNTDLTAETARGKAELERAFGRPVSVFVPPHDWINTRGVVAVEAAGLDVIRGRGAGLRNWLWRWQYATNFLRTLWFRFPHYRSYLLPVYPYVLDFGKHKELCSYRLEDADIFDGLAKAARAEGIFVIVTHLHTFTPEKKARLMQLITQARALGASFVYPHEAFRSAVL